MNQSSHIANAEAAMATLLESLKPIDARQGLLVELVEAWGDLSFDDRRYLGTAFPRLVNALLALEDQLK